MNPFPFFRVELPVCIPETAGCASAVDAVDIMRARDGTESDAPRMPVEIEHIVAELVPPRPPLGSRRVSDRRIFLELLDAFRPEPLAGRILHFGQPMNPAIPASHRTCGIVSKDHAVDIEKIQMRRLCVIRTSAEQTCSLSRLFFAVSGTADFGNRNPRARPGADGIPFARRKLQSGRFENIGNFSCRIIAPSRRVTI